MSDRLYLIVGVVGTFLTVLLARIAWVVSSRSRRPSRVLVTQLHAAGVAMPTRPDAGFGERIVVPTVSALARLALRLTPVGAREAVDRKLVLAGSPKGWTPERVLAMKGLCTLLGIASGALVAPLLPFRLAAVATIPVLGAIGYLTPGATLGQAVLGRQERIRRSVADTIDLLTISVEAGLSFDAALLHVRRTMKGPLAEEIGRMLHEIQLGVARPEALRHLADRTDVPELKGFILAMVQADVFGVSVANVLRAQSDEVRTKRRQYAEERAMKIPVKLLFPMIGCEMPALFTVIMGPAAILIYRTFVAGGGF